MNIDKLTGNELKVIENVSREKHIHVHLGNRINDIIKEINGIGESINTIRLLGKYEVTTVFDIHEIINIQTGIGEISGITTIGGDASTISLGGDNDIFNEGKNFNVYLNGIKQRKGVDFIRDSSITGYFNISLSIGDYFEIED